MTCRICQSNKTEAVLRLDHMPLAGGFLEPDADLADEVFLPITVLVCGDCGLVQIEEVVDPDLLFRKYYFSTKTIASLVQHFQAYARFLAHEVKARKVVEFGCNDGTLLTALRDQGVATLGFDASENISEIARDNGLEVVNRYFEPEAAEAVLARLGKVDIVTGSNCFAHNRDPKPILDAARACLAEDGLLSLEVMSAGDLLSDLQWDTLYHEHLAVYGLTSMANMLRLHGYAVVDVHHLPMHGGSLRVLASPNPSARPHARVAAMLAAEQAAGLADPATWREFGDKVRRQIHTVGQTINAIADKHRVWAYGASGRATMWMNACAMTGIERVVDESPLRAGRLMPGLHTPIVPPEALRADPPDYMLVTAWNYAESIRAKTDWYPGIWVTPLPVLRFV